MDSKYTSPLNLGTDELVTVNQLVDFVCNAAGKNLIRKHDLTKPQGVRGRNSDNSLLNDVLGWAPRVTLEQGIKITYDWIRDELDQQNKTLPSKATDISDKVKTSL